MGFLPVRIGFSELNALLSPVEPIDLVTSVEIDIGELKIDIVVLDSVAIVGCMELR